MIRVQPQAEPSNFDKLVRQPGNTLLKTTPQPTSTQWNSEKFALWRKIKNELHDAYKGICAYSCHWMPYDTGWRTVEHFKPKESFANEAYDWDNYRLVCGVLNGRKSNRTVLDPFEIQNGWFVLDFPALLVKPAKDLKNPLRQQVIDTCTILGLNDESTCLKSRKRYLELYCIGEIPFTHIEREAPFLAKELTRQDLKEEIKDIMGYL